MLKLRICPCAFPFGVRWLAAMPHTDFQTATGGIHCHILPMPLFERIRMRRYKTIDEVGTDAQSTIETGDA